MQKNMHRKREREREGENRECNRREGEGKRDEQRHKLKEGTEKDRQIQRWGRGVRVMERKGKESPEEVEERKNDSSKGTDKGRETHTEHR